MFVMKEEFITGIESIDQEHRELFEIANRAYDTLMDEYISDKYDYIIEIFNELKEYAVSHFAHEEEYMRSIGYKRLFSHKIEHEAFLEKVQSYDLNDIDDNQKGVILEILNFLGDWLVKHILENDKMIVQP